MINKSFEIIKIFLKKCISGVVFSLTIITLMVVLSGCQKNTYTSVIRIYTSKNCFNYSLIEEFEKENNVKVLYKVFENADTMWEKLKNSPELCDIVIAPRYVINDLESNNLLAALENEKIPNLSLIDSQYAELLSNDERKYSSVLFFEVLGILYNKDLVLDLGVVWDTLWDKKYSQQIMMPDNAIDLMNVALKSLDFSINTKNYVEIESAIQKILSQKEMVNAYNKVGIESKFRSGEIVIAAIKSSSAMKLMEDIPEMNFNFIIPHQGTNLDFEAISIMDSSKRKNDCMKFINYLYDTDISHKLTQYTKLSFTNKRSMEAFLRDNSKFSDIFYPPSYVMERCELFMSYENMVYERNKTFNQVSSK